MSREEWRALEKLLRRASEELSADGGDPDHVTALEDAADAAWIQYRKAKSDEAG